MLGTVFLLEPHATPDGWVDVLDAEERQRLSRFHFEADRACFLAAHGLLRHALSRNDPSVAPADWRFARGPHGKPFDPARPALHFNLSHCRPLVAVAIAPVPVGVDVEPVDPRHATRLVAERVYGPHELADLDAQPSDAARVERFFTRWVLKEAWVKATGVGLHDDLRRVELSIDGASACIERGEVGAFQFHHLTPTPGIKLGLCGASAFPLSWSVSTWVQG